MSIALGPGATGDKLAAKQDAGTDVTYEINGDLRTISGSTDAYGSLAQGALSTSATALVGPSSGTDMIISNMTFSNPGTSTRVVTFYKTRNSTTYDATTQWGTVTLLPGECAEYGNGGWQVFTAQGLPKLASIDGGFVVTNASTTDQVGFASDTYLAGSAILLPTGLIRAKTMCYWAFDVAKTAACTGTPTIIIRVGTGGAIGDTARVTFTFSAQTAAVDRGVFEVWAAFRTVGSGTSAVVQGSASIKHQLATTGLNSTTTGYQQVSAISGGFDSTVAGSYIGLSVNGTSTTAPAVWTVTTVQASAYM